MTAELTMSSSSMEPMLLSPNPCMMLTLKRIAYLGLLGAPKTRCFGATIIYSGLKSPFTILPFNQAPQISWMAIVPPYTPHIIKSRDRYICNIMVEDECTTYKTLARDMNIMSDSAIRRIRHVFTRIGQGRIDSGLNTTEFDDLFFNRSLPSRPLDHRIAKTVEHLRQRPHENIPATELADILTLSFSRFLHLFKDEVGVTYRQFRAWKRARAVLTFANGPMNATLVAMETGYPDSSHFSHSIRHYFGLRPKDIFAGSQRLRILTSSAQAAQNLPR